MKKINRIFLFGLIPFVFASCGVGLGEAVDLVGPEVTITAPIMRECVSEDFTISGTAYDNSEVKRLTVTVDGNEWKHENGEWTYKESGTNSYIAWADAEWKIENNKINWKIEKANITNSGRQLVVVSAIDEAGNTSADSQKVVTVIYDKAPPVTTITNPYIKYENLSEIKAAFPNSSHTELQIVNNVLTGGFTISGVTKDDNPINYVRVYVNKEDGTNLVKKDLKLKGATITGVSLTNPEEKDTLRSWTVEITDSNLSSLGSGKTYLQIATEAADASGNSDAGVKVHGYVLLWKDANKPWITVNVGGTKTDRTNVYSGSKIQGTAYDNKKVTEVRCTIKKDGGSAVSGYNNIALDLGSTGEDVVQATNFSFDYPSDVGIYQISLTAKDENGNTSSTEGWIEVQDMTFPSIEVEEIENPFGDASGKIVIKAHAYDDTGVKNIKYKICTTPADKTNYASKNSTSWSSPTATITSLGTAESVIQNGFARKKYNKDIEINLFSAPLNIGMNANKLEQTTFIFLVEDLQGNKSITKFVLPADTTPPTVTLDTVAGKAATVSSLPIFLGDFEISGTWGDDSFEAWKTNSTSVSKGKPKLVVKIRGTELTSGVTQSNDGTWKATVPLNMVKESGSVVGAMDVEVSITDIGGSTTTVQKGYQIDTDVPTLDYVSCDKINGTYPAGTEIEIYLNMTREFVFDGANKTGTPVLNLNNSKTAAYQKQDGKKLVFKYTVATGDDKDKLLVSSVDLKGYKIKAKSSDNEFKATDLNTAIATNNINKDICILTSVPKYKSHSWAWNNTTKVGTLTLVFEGLVTANSGNVEIVQDESTIVAPAYLTKDEYNNMPAAVQKYYKEGTIGASSAFVSDLTTKYVLDYDTNTDNATLVAAYIATGSHKRSVDIKSENVTSTQNTTAKTTTFTIKFTELPCKGASYILKIPNGLVKNDAKTTNVEEGAALEGGKMIKSIPSTQIKYDGIEPPVIRIKKAGQDIKNWNATQQLTTTFKVDCRTPGASVSYTYDAYTSGNYVVTRGAQQFRPKDDYSNIQEEIEVDFDYTAPNNSHTYQTTQKGGATRNGNTYAVGGKPASTFVKDSSKSSSGTTFGTIGTNSYAAGLKYEITATATKDSKTEKAYEVAYRTTIAFKDFWKLEDGYNYGGTKAGVKTSSTAWPYNNNLRMFIRGSDNKEGANSTAGLPCSWDINDPTAIAMLTPDSTARDEINYYFTTWSITVDKFYFKFMAGLCDDQTNTVNGVSQGPQYSRYCSEGLLFRAPEFPVGKGEYLILYDKDIDKYGVAFVPAPMKHR